MSKYTHVGLSGEMADRMGKLTNEYLDKVLDQFNVVFQTKDDVFIGVVSYFGAMMAHHSDSAMLLNCLINILRNYEETKFEILKKEMNNEAE